MQQTWLPSVNNSPPPVKRLYAAAFALIWTLPFIRALLLLGQYSVNVFFGDDFDCGNFLNLARSTAVGWGDLIAQHNESRFLTLRSLTLVLASLHRPFDIRLLMLASLATVGFTAWMLLRLTCRTFASRSTAWLVAILINLLLFLPSQWLNFLWGVQWIVFVPMAALATGLVFLDETVPLKIGWPIAAVAAAFANYTNSNGFLIWVLLLLPQLWRRSPHRAASITGWVVFASASIGYYFHGYVRPPGQSPAWIAIAHPAESLGFLLAFLGNGLRCSDRPVVAIWIGGVATALLALACGFLCISCDRSLVRKALPWMILACYSILSGMLATAGRFTLGTLGAITPRYSTFAIPFHIALVVLWTLASQARGLHRQTVRSITAAILIATVLLCLQSNRFVGGEMKHYRAARLTSLAMVQWSEVITDDASTAHALFPSPSYAYAVLAGLKQNGYLPPKLFFNSDQIDGVLDESAQSRSAGKIESTTFTESGLHLTGWAQLPENHRSADAVLIAARTPDGHSQIIAITGDVRRNHPASGKSADLGWDCTLPRATIRQKGTKLSAWAYDAVERKVFRLDGTVP